MAVFYVPEFHLDLGQFGIDLEALLLHVLDLRTHIGMTSCELCPHNQAFSHLLVELVLLRVVALPEHHDLGEVDDAALLQGLLVVHRSQGPPVQDELLPVI